MRASIVDTNAYSALARDDEKIVRLLHSIDRLVFPFIVVGELYAGFRLGSREDSNRTAFRKLLATRQTSILYADAETPEHYAAIFAELRRAGTLIPTNDIWIAAIARQHDLPLCSLDSHFKNVNELTLLGAE